MFATKTAPHEPTPTEIWLAEIALGIAHGTSSGYLRARPPEVRPLDLDLPKPNSPTELGEPRD